ncbi:uncharacterized protein LOC141628297 [Silene latifolia]|uniref:uncharacterized protein LOC141628297 n=1 Tax=Silene latifolia TaxID=37657 RepID=UPI003D78238F
MNKTSKEDSIRYKARLTQSLDCVKYLLHQGLAFRGHNEKQTSSNKGNFRELLDWLAKKDENINELFEKGSQNARMICPDVQKDLIHSCAKETTKLILEELGDDYFGILADESSDVSHKEQLAICLRFVDKKGKVCESFLGVVKVDDTCSLSLKDAITKMIKDNKLSMSKIRGQGYDGASNMKGHIQGLKTLILSDIPSAYYIHCFAHQLQLTLVAVARDNCDCKWFFEQAGFLLNLMGISCKRKEMLRVAHTQKIIQVLELGEISSGQGSNQRCTLARPGETRWGSYYNTILSILTLYPSIFEVLIYIGETGHKDDRLKAQTIMVIFESFQFVFMANLMLLIFGYTDDLCKALQRKDQDIVNAMTLVRLTKARLQKVRVDGWADFIESVNSFCSKNDIEVPNMDNYYVPPGRSRRYFVKVKNLDRFRVDMFLSMIDLQLQELDNRFDEVNMELLTCMSCLSPVDSFKAFDKKQILKLATFYLDDFSSNDMRRLNFQLDHYFDDVRNDPRFEGLKDIGQVSMALVATNKHLSYELVYLLIRLVLILPVATANVERAFSAMTYVKNKLRNCMGDQLLNDCLVTFIEKDTFRLVENDDVLDSFQRERTSHISLPPRS